MTEDAISRRTVIVAAGAAGLAAPIVAEAATLGPSAPAPIDTGSVPGGRFTFGRIDAASEPKTSEPPNPDPRDRRVGFAIVGLGRLATENILPAFAGAKHARIAALVSGTPDKMRTLAAQYGVAPESCYSYDQMERLRDNRGVDAVYIVTPNALHRRDVEAAAGAGEHVLCEKPMATSSADCRAMIAACRAANVKLMIAYRMQYQPHLREATRLLRGGALGEVRLLDLINNQRQGDPTQWRLKRAMAGGGSLPDVGVYCINTARAVLGEEPIAVTASTWSPPGDPRFAEVECNAAFTLRFPSGAMATCQSSYDTHRLARLKLIGTTGWLEMENAFDYAGQRLRIAATRDGRAEVAERTIPADDQFGLEIDHFAQCIRRGRTPRTPGAEGLQDQYILEAIYEAARSGRGIKLQPVAGIDPFRGPLLETVEG